MPFLWSSLVSGLSCLFPVNCPGFVLDPAHVDACTNTANTHMYICYRDALSNLRSVKFYFLTVNTAYEVCIT